MSREGPASRLVSAALAVGCAVGVALVSHPTALATLHDILQNIAKHNSTLESALKNGKFILNYTSLVVPGELGVRAVGLLALCFAYSTNFLRPWSTVNLITFSLESGLLIRAVWLTWGVVRDHYNRRYFSEKELSLYTTHFERLGLSKREFRALLDAGAVWKQWTPPTGQGHAPSAWLKLQGALTMEGKRTRSFMLITKGSCTVLRGGAEVGRLGVGALVGEREFVLRLTATPESRAAAAEAAGHEPGHEFATTALASVIPAGPVEYVAWPKAVLAKHMARSSYTKACVLTMIAVSQAAKLTATNDRVKKGADELAELTRSMSGSASPKPPTPGRQSPGRQSPKTALGRSSSSPKPPTPGSKPPTPGRASPKPPTPVRVR